MAGDWIKMRTDLRDDPAVVAIALQLGHGEDLIVGKLHRLWSWADRHTSNGTAVGVTTAWLDKYADCEGLSLAMCSVEWLAVEGASITFPNFERHNGESAKKRLDATLRQRKARDISVTNVTPMSQKSVTREEKRREDERREEKITRRKDSNRQESPSTLSTKEFSDKREGKFDLSHLTGEDWVRIVAMAELAAKRVRPITLADRRAWLKYAVMAFSSLSEHWLLDAAESAATAREVAGTRQALFVRSLQNGAKEKHDVEVSDFNAMCARIEVPIEIWKSDAIPVKRK